MGQPGRWDLLATSSGRPLWAWERPIPRLPDFFLDCAIYLYGSEADAVDGVRTGGSGFLVLVESEALPGGGYCYAVTNAHVIEGGSYTIRLNTIDGKTEIANLDERHWIIPESKDDIAVCLLAGLNPKAHKIRTVEFDKLVDRSRIEELAIGPGDEVFTVGRFVNADGKQKNLPSLRFGNLAQMPWEPVVQDRVFGAYEQESFLVEAKSIGGFSGSPVFTWLNPRWKRPDKPDLTQDWILLLGICWGYILDWERVCDERGKPLATNAKVRVNTGMMGVVPSWKLRELLMRPDLVEIRRNMDKVELRRRGPAPTSALSDLPKDGASLPANDENPNHQEDFTRLVSLAARKPEPKG